MNPSGAYVFFEKFLASGKRTSETAPFLGNSVSRARVHNCYTSPTSTSGSSLSVAEKRTFGALSMIPVHVRFGA